MQKDVVDLKQEPIDEFPAAFWGGPATVKSKQKSTHIVSVDCKVLPEKMNLSGCFSLYFPKTNCIDGVSFDEAEVIFDDSLVLSSNDKDSIALYPTKRKSLPPLEAFYYCAPKELIEYIKSTGAWSEEWYWNEPWRSMANDYEAIWQDQFPVYQEDIFLTIGGWHMQWPDGDWEEFLDSELICLTVKDAEPWIEVWQTNRGIKVIERIT